MMPPRFCRAMRSPARGVPTPIRRMRAISRLAGAETIKVSSLFPLKRLAAMARRIAPPLSLSRRSAVAESLRFSMTVQTTVPVRGIRGAAKLIFMSALLDPLVRAGR